MNSDTGAGWGGRGINFVRAMFGLFLVVLDLSLVFIR